MQTVRGTTTRTCAICERTLLMGERVMRFSPDGVGFVDVCPLCPERALEHGWTREGSPMIPTVPVERRRRGSLSLSAIFGGARRSAAEPSVAGQPILRRLSPHEQALVEAADLFNESPFRRTVEGIGRSLGEPQVSIVPRSGVNTELVITIVWDISWHQYRVVIDSPRPLALAERGLEPEELDPKFTAWNAGFDEYWRLVPDIAPA